MNFLSLIPGFSFFRLGIVVVLLLAEAALVWKVRHTALGEGRAQVQAVWDAERAQVAIETAALLALATEKTTTLQVRADKERGTLNARIRSIDLELDESLRRLRTRPSRPAEGADGVPANTGSGPNPVVCSGAGLFAQDAEFLSREAARADVLRLGLKACEARYKDAQNAVNAMGEH